MAYGANRAEQSRGLAFAQGHHRLILREKARHSADIAPCSQSRPRRIAHAAGDAAAPGKRRSRLPRRSRCALRCVGGSSFCDDQRSAPLASAAAAPCVERCDCLSPCEKKMILPDRVAPAPDDRSPVAESREKKNKKKLGGAAFQIAQQLSSPIALAPVGRASSDGRWNHCGLAKTASYEGGYNVWSVRSGDMKETSPIAISQGCHEFICAISPEPELRNAILGLAEASAVVRRFGLLHVACCVRNRPARNFGPTSPWRAPLNPLSVRSSKRTGRAACGRAINAV